MSIIDALAERGIIHQQTSKELATFLSQKRKIYMGIDPTGFLHIGHAVGLNICKRLQDAGHEVIIVIGTATALIGDPSGKSKERNLLDEETVRRNADSARKEIDTFFGGSKVQVVENGDWFKQINMIEFLRDIGKSFRVGSMMGKESVRNRMNSDEGMSFTEFSYQLLQAYDFYHMKTHFGIEVQIGGSDQWGNIVAGIDFAAKKGCGGLFGFTFPLLTKADGTKFGKTEKGALWLDPNKCKPEEVYQYMYRSRDDDVLFVMRLMTDIATEDIVEYEKRLKCGELSPNFLQEKLASAVVTKLHGEVCAQRAQQSAKALGLGKKESDLSDIEALCESLEICVREKDAVIENPVIDLFVDVGLVKSKGEIKKLIKQCGASLNNQVITDIHFVIKETDLLKQKYLLLSVGKKKKKVIQLK